MRAAGVRQIGGPVELLWLPHSRAVRADEVLIDVQACGAGNWDEFVRTGGWDTGASPPMALGVEAAGHVAVVPPGVPVDAAAALPVPALTADQALTDGIDLRSGQTVLVHGAGGVTGGLLVQLAACLGARVVATSSPGDAARISAMGADIVLDYHQPGWPQRVISMTGGATRPQTNGGSRWSQCWSPRTARGFAGSPGCSARARSRSPPGAGVSRVSTVPAARSALLSRRRGIIMAVLSASRAVTPAAGAPAGESDVVKLGEYGSLRYAVLAFGIAAAAFFAAWGLHGNTSSTYRIDGQWSAFTGLFVLALAIERALEPFSRKLGPDTTRRKDAKDRVLASTHADDTKEIAVECQLAVDRCRRLTAVVTWGVATGLAFMLCAELNITFMQAVRASGSGAPPFWADLLVTGLVVGAGTKPLHDLVSTIERGRQGPSPGSDRAR